MNMSSLPFFGITFIVGSILGQYLLNQGFTLLSVLIICFATGILLGFIGNLILPKKDDNS